MDMRPMKMLSQQSLFSRRPSGRMILMLTGSLLFIILLLTIRLSNVRAKASAYLPGHSESFDNLNDVFNRTLGFEKIFVINLKSRTDRRDAIILSAAASGIDLEIVDGVYGDTVIDKVVPQGNGKMSANEKGCWRSHMNIIQEIVQKNISSALILEDDADWDVRIKQQLHDFALGTRTLLQPLLDDPAIYADPTYPTPLDGKFVPKDIHFHNLPPTVLPKVSPYGDNWDFFWLGHCTMRFPNPGLLTAPPVPKGRVVTLNEPTVPGLEGLPHLLWGVNELGPTYPAHTRVVHHVAEGMCATGYAISQHGAREALLELGLTQVDDAYDTLLRQFCDGSDVRKYHNCLAANPSLFQPHKAAGSKSADTDIQLVETGVREKGMTEGIRWSTRLNLNVLLAGGTDFEDAYPIDGPTVPYPWETETPAGGTST